MKANKFFAIALAALTLGFVACKDKKNEPQPDKLAITAPATEVNVGATLQLSANMEVTWSSSDNAIAGVNDKGLVTGVAEGEATITAKAVKSNELATCKIKVVPGGVTPPDPKDIPEIDVTDGSLADWDALPAEFVVEAVCPEEASLLGLKKVKVYATSIFLYVLVEIDEDEIADRSWTPFHMYINTDNSDETGGYGDQYADANTDVMLEGALFSGDAPCEFNPGASNWYGEVGGSGWEWCPEGAANDESDCWCATVCAGDMPIGVSECVDGKFEIQILRELIPSNAGWNENEFGIGFDIQQNWSSAGVLPQVNPTEDNPSGLANKLQVKINK